MANNLTDVYHSIKAALDIFKHSAAPTPDVPSKQSIIQAAEKIKTDAAKIGIMCSGSTPPTDQLDSLASSLQQSCVAFCSSCHTLTATAGPTLKGELVKVVQGIVNPCLVLVKEMASGKDLKPNVAVVWDGVAAVAKTPMDNKSCLFKSLAAIMMVMKDTAREMEELEQEQQEQYGDAADQQAAAAAADSEAGQASSSNAAGDGSSSSQPSSAAAAAAGDADDESSSDDEDDGDFGVDYEGGQMSGIERQLLGSCMQLLAASTGTLKAFGKALLQGPELLVGTELLDGWESCLFHCRHLRRAAEDLGAALYPPQDFEEVDSAALAVYEVTELMADECPDADAVGAEQLSSLAAQLKAAHERVQELLVVAHQQANNEGQEA